MLSFNSKEPSLDLALCHYPISIIGFYGDPNESIIDKEYVQYGVERISERFKQTFSYTQHGICDIYKNLYPNLSHLADDGDLYLIGHSSVNRFHEPTFADKEADHIVELLFEDCELSNAKSITFISCNLGLGTFLSKFKSAINNNEYLEDKPKPLLFAYTKPIKVSLQGTLWVDHGEDLGFETAEQFKVTI